MSSLQAGSRQRKAAWSRHTAPPRQWPAHPPALRTALDFLGAFSTQHNQNTPIRWFQIAPSKVVTGPAHLSNIRPAARGRGGHVCCANPHQLGFSCVEERRRSSPPGLETEEPGKSLDHQARLNVGRLGTLPRSRLGLQVSNLDSENCHDYHLHHHCRHSTCRTERWSWALPAQARPPSARP